MYRGYVVHIKDALNFYIDIDNLPQQKDRAIISDYPYFYRDDESEIRYTYPYKCRLVGVKMPLERSELRHATAAIRKLIDRMDGWVWVKVFPVDKYSRLVVDLIDSDGNSLKNELITTYGLAPYQY